MKYSFKNDYSNIAHKNVLEKLLSYSDTQFDGYGHDIITKETTNLLKEMMNYDDVDIHFLAGGTQTNMVTISLFLKRYEAVISPDTGHINTFETGAIESSGSKIYTAKNIDGKITAKQIEEICLNHDSYHEAKPKMVCISNSTELGTVYTKTELESISKVCKQYGLYLFIDGARLGCALTSTSSDVTLNDLCNLCDAFYIGGTKNGTCLGELLVIVNDEFKEEFKYHQKNKGALLAKTYFVALNFKVILEDNLFFDLAKSANEKAMYLYENLLDMGFDFLLETKTNQIFVIFENELIDKIKDDYGFSIWQDFDHDSKVIRLVTSFSTTLKDCEEFIKYIKENL